MKIAFTKEAKIGIVSIVSLVLLYVGINYLKGINLFKPVNHYYVAFNNVKGITISSPVYVEGFKVGLVRDIVYDYNTTGKITVEVSLEDEMRVNKGSYITVFNSFLGGSELHIHLNTYVDEYLKPGDTIEGRIEEEMMQAVQAQTHDICRQWRESLVELAKAAVSAGTGYVLSTQHEDVLRSLLLAAVRQLEDRATR